MTCKYSLNSTGVYTDTTCGISGSVVTITGIFNNILVRTLSLKIGNVVNPYPAGQTDRFAGTIGTSTSNTTSVGASNARVTITAALAACSFTFSPNFVYTSPTDLIMTMTTVNEFPTSGTIQVAFSTTRKWSQDLDSSRTMPITDGNMVCTNKSAVSYILFRMLIVGCSVQDQLRQLWSL